MEKSVEFKWHPEYEKSSASYSNSEIQAARHNWTKAVMYDSSLAKSASARNIAFALMDRFFNSKTGQCNPSLAKLGAIFGLKITATKNMLKVLEEAKWIEIIHRQDPDNEKHSLSNQYRLMKIEFKKQDAKDQAAENDNRPHRNSEGGVAEYRSEGHRDSVGGGIRIPIPNHLLLNHMKGTRGVLRPRIDGRAKPTWRRISS